MTNQDPLPVENAPKTLVLEPYLTDESLRNRLSMADDGARVILAQQDNASNSVIVYQAFSKDIAAYAVQHQRLLGAPGYKSTRMTWIKPSFLWMQYRSGWNTKDERQERTLAIKLRRPFFDHLITSAVLSSHHRISNNKQRQQQPQQQQPPPSAPLLNFSSSSKSALSKDDWLEARAKSSVVVQWDPDYTPSLVPERITTTNRRAIQLGLKGEAAARLAKGITTDSGDDDIVSIEDITPFVNEMRSRLERDKNNVGQERFVDLWVPVERPYSIDNETTV